MDVYTFEAPLIGTIFICIYITLCLFQVLGYTMFDRQHTQAAIADQLLIMCAFQLLQ